eukprot:GHVQ01012622.1.p1 GENE.GHVQ01012622.1~~GHVQ01012622.1.p1  ORF type:complete len:1003 (+),score=105.04 GHVQ01012622.1:1181-4189(+)
MLLYSRLSCRRIVQCGPCQSDSGSLNRSSVGSGINNGVTYRNIFLLIQHKLIDVLLLSLLPLHSKPRDMYLGLVDILISQRVNRSYKLLVLGPLASCVNSFHKQRVRNVVQVLPLMLNKFFPHRTCTLTNSVLENGSTLDPQDVRSVISVDSDAEEAIPAASGSEGFSSAVNCSNRDFIDHGETVVEEMASELQSFQCQSSTSMVVSSAGSCSYTLCMDPGSSALFGPNRRPNDFFSVVLSVMANVVSVLCLKSVFPQPDDEIGVAPNSVMSFAAQLIAHYGPILPWYPPDTGARYCGRLSKKLLCDFSQNIPTKFRGNITDKRHMTNMDRHAAQTSGSKSLCGEDFVDGSEVDDQQIFVSIYLNSPVELRLSNKLTAGPLSRSNSPSATFNELSRIPSIFPTLRSPVDSLRCLVRAFAFLQSKHEISDVLNRLQVTSPLSTGGGDLEVAPLSVACVSYLLLVRGLGGSAAEFTSMSAATVGADPLEGQGCLPSTCSLEVRLRDISALPCCVSPLKLGNISLKSSYVLLVHSANHLRRSAGASVDYSGSSSLGWSESNDIRDCLLQKAYDLFLLGVAYLDLGREQQQHLRAGAPHSMDLQDRYFQTIHCLGWPVHMFFSLLLESLSCQPPTARQHIPVLPDLSASASKMSAAHQSRGVSSENMGKAKRRLMYHAICHLVQLWDWDAQCDLFIRLSKPCGTDSQKSGKDTVKYESSQYDDATSLDDSAGVRWAGPMMFTRENVGVADTVNDVVMLMFKTQFWRQLQGSYDQVSCNQMFYVPDEEGRVKESFVKLLLNTRRLCNQGCRVLRCSLEAALNSSHFLADIASWLTTCLSVLQLIGISDALFPIVHSMIFRDDEENVKNNPIRLLTTANDLGDTWEQIISRAPSTVRCENGTGLLQLLERLTKRAELEQVMIEKKREEGNYGEVGCPKGAPQGIDIGAQEAGMCNKGDRRVLGGEGIGCEGTGLRTSRICWILDAVNSVIHRRRTELCESLSVVGTVF